MGLFSRKGTMESVIKIGYDGKEAERGLKNLKKMAGSVIGAVALQRMARYTWALGNLGARADLVAEGFAKRMEMIGRSPDKGIKQLQQATLGMISDMELQQNAMKALIAGIDFDDLVTAMEFVSRYAISTGDDVSVRMNTIMTGLARGSAKMLDDVGIIVKGTENVVGRAIDQMREKMDDFTVSEDDAAVAAEQLRIDLENLKVEIGQELQPAFIATVGLLTDLVSGFSQLRKEGNLLKTTLDIIDEAFAFTSVSGFLSKDLRKRMSDIVMPMKEIETVGSRILKNSEDRNKLLEKEQGITERLDRLKSNSWWLMLSAGQRQERINELEEKRTGIQKKLIENAKELKGITETDAPDKTGTTPKKKEPKEEPETEREMRARIKAEKKTLQLIRAANEADAKAVWEYKKRLQEEGIESEEEYTNWAIENAQKAFDKKQEIDEEARRQVLGDDQFEFESRMELLDTWALLYTDKVEQIEIIRTELQKKYSEKRKAQEREEAEEKVELLEKGLDVVTQIAGSIMEVMNAGHNNRIKKLNSEREKELDNARTRKEREEIEIKYNTREKAMEEENQKRQQNFARTEFAVMFANASAQAILIALSGAAKTPGGVISKLVAYSSLLGPMIGQAAKIKSLATFQTGYEGSHGYQPDVMPSLIGVNESVVPGPQSAQHKEEISNIINNGANTDAGRTSSQIVNNFYGATTEQVATAATAGKRYNRKGKFI